MKAQIIIFFILGLALSVTVKEENQCSACKELQSQLDCENKNHNLKCQWKDDQCVPTENTFQTYCEQIEDPATNCSSTFGCAYVDNKCTHFTGCTAYVKSTLKECQEISIKCISNGITCSDALDCSQYTTETCESSPSRKSPYKCKLENEKCRNYRCTDSDDSLTTDSECNNWLSGCVTKGAGCIDKRLPCSKYTGSLDTCNNMIGADGKCTFNSTTSDQCKARTCSEAQLSTWDNASCSEYKSGCKSTGFSCVETYVSCTNYEGDATSCLNYIGLEGYCAGDVSSSKCKARKCEDKQSSVLSECSEYLSGCVTNGVSCVTTLQNCNKYTGTISTCVNITGLDGKCKGISDSEDKSCSLRDCIKDSLGTETTNIDCEAVQFGCKATGAGCVTVLQSCTTYNDDGNCLSMIGSEGKCKEGLGGTNPKCTPRQCSDNKTASTNDECKDYKSECVTNGTGCVNEMECEKTVLMDSCQGTNESYKCGWTSNCVNKQCSSLITESECQNTKISLEQPCIWKTSLCQNAICSDYISTDNTICDSYMKGCVTNGVKCANPNYCTEFQGTMTTCRQYKASCTNTSDSVAATTNCIPKTCGDSNITANSDSDCESHLTGCLFAGNNKCLANSKDCTYYTGNSTDQCKIFTGYLTSTTRSVCWWVSGTNCTNKLCTQATGMINDSDCETFLNGCIFDGKNSCVFASAGCSSFKYNTNASDCRNLKGVNNTESCYDGLSGNCKKRECSDSPNTNDTDIKCESFLTGCLSNGSGCYDSTSSCTNLTGTSSQCSKLKGNSIPCLRKQACKSVTFSSCANKQDALSIQDCQGYSSTCVLTYGTSNCQTTEAACTGYSLSNTSTQDKSMYCNQVKTTGGTYCAFDPSTANTCVSRQCSFWNNQIGVLCSSYAGTSACSLANSNYCYLASTCESFIIPIDTSNKLTWCNNIKNSSNKYCTYDQSVSTTNCKTMNKCEEAIAPTGIDECFTQTGQSCLLIGSSCISFKTNCSSYDITAITQENRSSVCSKLQSNNGGVISKCSYVSGTVCDISTAVELTTCESILNPTKQRNCDYLSNCKYYASKCYTIKSCTSYTYPANVNSEALKQLFCQNMKNTGGTDFCSYTAGSQNCDVPKSCSEYTGLTAGTTITPTGYYNFGICKKKRDKAGSVCIYTDNATTCSLPPTANICNTLDSGMTNTIDCDIRTIPNQCQYYLSMCVSQSTCIQTSGSTQTICRTQMGPDGYYCTYQTGSKCSVAPDSCTAYADASIVSCNEYVNKYGDVCTWTSGGNCADPEVLKPINSQLDCDQIAAGNLFYSSQCITKQAACTSYTFPSSINTVDLKFKFCNGIITSSGERCTFTNGSSNCISVATCSTYAKLGAIFSDNLTYCQKIATTDNYKCVYLSGANCQETADSCTSYTGMAAATITVDCALLFDTLGRFCAGVAAATTCSYPLCDTIVSPANKNDCDAKAPGCLYSSNKCITPGLCSSYSTGGSGAIAFCGGLKDSSGVQCFASTDTQANCTARACNDSAALYLTTHQECQEYSTKCKFGGLGCVDITAACATLNGDSTTCPLFMDETGSGKCEALVAATDTAACAAKSCEMNVTALNQSDCDSFIPDGGCRWRNPGCYDQSVPCNQYRGTSIECQGFIGNNKLCFGDSATRGACRDIVCTDKVKALDDVECNAYMDGCIFNGVGCVSKLAGCSAYQGTSETCLKFKGNNGNTLCWSTSTTQAACIDRQCTHLKATTDAECQAHLNINCITDGTTCVQGPKQCSDFKGNYETCSKFTASDGPCKESSISNAAEACTPRICSEAQNTFITDQQCKDYHPSCKTNGRGCQTTVTCGEYQIESACSVNSSCLWINSCRTSTQNCSSLTSKGQSVCTNNPTKKCAWQNKELSTDALCREYICEDYDSAITTHDQCMLESNNKCTTSGAGCVTFGKCASYTSPIMCASAQTTEITKKCTWDNTQCRQLKCQDLKGITDDECNTQLNGCKSNGTNCIGSTYDCSVFNGSQKFCLIDSNGQPCLYVNGTCYSYDNCTDVTSQSQLFCQSFSNNCVIGNTTCRALNQCSEYDKISCLIGINNTKCGWLPTNKCAEFKQCSDATGKTWAECALWNTSCVSDGTACVPIGDCSTYLTSLSCKDNRDINNNQCIWTEDTCRLKQCSDVIAKTDTQCSTNIFKEGQCTTNGTTCVIRSTCSSYITEASCTVGSDGIPCIFAYPIGQTTGVKSCRPKDCTDIKGTNNQQCKGKINNKQCISDGKTCINQGTCSSYKNNISCAGGGSDNSQCAFSAVSTATNPSAGICQAFSSCTMASGDPTTCVLNKSCKYTQSTKKCESTDCLTFNPNKGKCNPIPSFDGKSYILCMLIDGTCKEGDPNMLTQDDCYSTTSRYSYTWSAQTSKCLSCKASTSNNNTQNGSSIQNDVNSNTESENIIQFLIIAVIIMLV